MIKLRFSIISLLILLGCANRGTPTGGEIDTEPPVILKSSPENFTTNFSAEEIEIIFNEYIRLNNTQKELIISPPIEPQPLIMPMGSASKVLTISEFDSLQKNTTYSFHFGESIEDNNERNPLINFRYVFSTGEYIDSLKIKGSVKDAFERANSFDRDKVRDAISATDMDTFYGSIKFSEAGNNIAKPMFYRQIQADGSYKNIVSSKDMTMPRKVSY